MDANPIHSNPVNEKNLDYTLTVQSIWAFLTLIVDYYSSISEVISSAKMAVLSIETAIRYTDDKVWRLGTETGGITKGGTGKQVTEKFVQTLVKGYQRFYKVQQNLCARAVNLREHLKARLPNLDAAKIKMLDDKLDFTRPRMDILTQFDMLPHTQRCYEGNIDKIRYNTAPITSYMMNLYEESVAKLYFLENYLAEILYSLPFKEATQINTEKNLPGPPLY